jgi:hypothetical protein
MPLPLKSKILETPGFLVTYYIKMFPLLIWTLNLQASLMVQCELSRICNYTATCHIEARVGPSQRAENM